MLNDERTWRDWLDELSEELLPCFRSLWAREERQTAKLLHFFREAGVGQHHFAPSTGYGLSDPGREALEFVFAGYFDTEAALVRQQIVSGTHAINLCLQALLAPGEEVLFLGLPYDTLQTAVGLRGKCPGSLAEKGVILRVWEPRAGWGRAAEELTTAIASRTRLLYVQRSGGYTLRPALSVRTIAEIVKVARAHSANPLVFVDNCYGEFVEDEEPTAVGADLMAGSLIKNPGGGLCPSGGYIVGRKELVARVAAQLYAPGLAGEMGPSLLSPRLFFQGFFQAPHLVAQALQGAILCARAFAALGYEVSPSWDDPRADLVQRLVFGSPEGILAFARAIQEASPVDARARPEPAPLPGYPDPVVMAGGTFVQGSSGELSFDAPLRPPYVGYWQGGLSFAHTKLALAHGLATINRGRHG